LVYSLDCCSGSPPPWVGSVVSSSRWVLGVVGYLISGHYDGELDPNKMLGRKRD